MILFIIHACMFCSCIKTHTVCYYCHHVCAFCGLSFRSLAYKDSHFVLLFNNLFHLCALSIKAHSVLYEFVVQ